LGEIASLEVADPSADMLVMIVLKTRLANNAVL
jgi:hypothetical protein